MPNDVGTTVQPVTAAEARTITPPPGYVVLFDRGMPALVRAEDRAAWEQAHGLQDEQYDIPESAARFSAAVHALPETVAQALEEFGALGLVRDEMAAALNAAMGETLDSYRFLMRCVGALLPREAAVADVAHLKSTGGLDALNSDHPARKLEALADALPTERLEAHRAIWAADEAARAAQEAGQ